jgi:hypothetical protein
MIRIVIADDHAMVRGGLPKERIRVDSISGWAPLARQRLHSMNGHPGSAFPTRCTCDEA